MNRPRHNFPPLLEHPDSGLSVFFATLCIVDIFGVFPIIALPRAIVQCGLLGIPLVFVVFGLEIYTATILGKSWTIATSLDPQISRKSRYPLAAVTELTLGKKARTMVTLLLDLSIFGGGIPNLLVASQNLQLFGSKVSGEEFDISFCYWLLLVGVLLCPLMWLGSPRDMKCIAACSCASVLLTATLVWWCVLTDDRIINLTPIPTSPSWDKFISGYGMLAFQFDVHPTLMTIQVDMRRASNIYKAVILAFIVSGSLFVVTVVMVVWRYGATVTANVLQLVPPSFTIYVAILLAALQLSLSSAIGHSALFQHIEDQLRIQPSFGWKRCAMRSAVVFLGVAIGESVPRFDIVMSLIGGTLIGPLVFVLPPLLYARATALASEATHSTHCSPLAPDILSTSEKRSYAQDSRPAETRAHSRSIYYGLLGTANSNTYRYSHLYYHDLDEEAEENLDFEERESKEEDEDASNDRLLFIDASQPSCRGRGRINANLTILSPRSTIFKDLKKTMNWYGYCIVLLGILITLSSTYINIKNTVRFVRFTPPCIVNATAAAVDRN